MGRNIPQLRKVYSAHGRLTGRPRASGQRLGRWGVKRFCPRCGRRWVWLQGMPPLDPRLTAFACAVFCNTRQAQAGIVWIPIILAGAATWLGTAVLTGDIWGPIKVIAEGFMGAADAVIALLPDAADLGLETSGFIFGYSWINSMLPVSETLAMVGVLIAIKMAVIGFRVAVIVYHLIPKPGVGT